MLVPAEPSTPGARWFEQLGRWMVDVPFEYTPPSFGDDANVDVPELQDTMRKAAEAARAAAAGVSGLGPSIQKVKNFLVSTKLQPAPDAVIEVQQTITRRMTVQELANELEVPLHIASRIAMGWVNANEHGDADSLIESGTWGQLEVRRVQ